MAKLINVIKEGEGELSKRQLPLVIDEKLTMVLDLKDVDFMCEYPKLRGKDKDTFLAKYNMLNAQELSQAFQVSCKRLLELVSDLVPCVGCRRSVERLFHQMKDGPGRTALYPLVVTPEGVSVYPDRTEDGPNVVGAMFHNYVSKMNELPSSWTTRSKKSSRCTLHSLDAQRYVRPPLGSGWKTLWECMVPFCKQEVATIDTAQLLSTLETYLQKHRFCTECRTKVMKAYSLLVDEPEERKGDGSNSDTNVCSSSCEHNHGDHTNSDEHCNSGSTVKEKGFIPSLYAGIRRCSPNNHIHVDQRTDYIMGLILAAEPELLGNRRERHAKTLEIAQEEVLVCVGLCLYERVHRIQLRLREEQTTCQLLAITAINALCTNFELAVEDKRGKSQLELWFEEFSREDQMKQRRMQIRKLKKRRKKERKNATANGSSPVDIEDDNEEKDGNSDDQKDEEDSDEADENEIIRCLIEKKKPAVDDTGCSIKSFPRANDRTEETTRSVSKYSEKKEDTCFCQKYDSGSKMPTKIKDCNRNNKAPKIHVSLEPPSRTKKRTIPSTASSATTSSTTITTSITTTQTTTITKLTGSSRSDDPKSLSPITCVAGYHLPAKEYTQTFSDSGSGALDLKYVHCGTGVGSNSSSAANPTLEAMIALTSCDYCANVHNDCGYGSADNNIISSSSNGSGDSSVDSSDVACSEGFCNHDGSEDCNFDTRNNGGGEAGGNVKRNSPNYEQIKNSIVILNSASQNLHHRLTQMRAAYANDTDPSENECTIPAADIEKYKKCRELIRAQREKERRRLQSQFAQLTCDSYRRATPEISTDTT